MNSSSTLRFIDLFAGLGGTRIGFEQACHEKGLKSQCVFSSEIKEHAIKTYKSNFNNEEVHGDITKIEPAKIPDHDFLLAGFPCQPFSSAGRRKGFLDERGSLFFSILEILKIKKPYSFLLENVEGLYTHNKGKTLKEILTKLHGLGYIISYKILDSSDFGVPQIRRRIYILGHKTKDINLNVTKSKKCCAEEFLENIQFEPCSFSKKLMEHYKYYDLYGKSIKDKRGGNNNIHSWDIQLKGSISQDQKKLLNELLKKRRYKKWSENKGIEWMDGMPLTLEEIKTFFDIPSLQQLLDDLVEKKYLTFEHPKKNIYDNGIKKRVFNEDSPKGYNIVAGKLSFPFSRIIDPKGFIPTIVATEVGKIAVATPQGVRPITVREGLRMSGFPESYQINLDYRKSFDLIGNTIIPPVVKFLSSRLID